MTERKTEPMLGRYTGWEYLDLGFKILETTPEATRFYNRVRQRSGQYGQSLERAVHHLYSKTVEAIGEADAIGHYAQLLYEDMQVRYPGLVVADSEEDGYRYFQSSERHDFYSLFVGERAGRAIHDRKDEMIGILFPTGHPDIAIKTNVDLDGTMLPSVRPYLLDELVIGPPLIARELKMVYEWRIAGNE